MHNTSSAIGADAASPPYMVFPFPVYEKAYSCLAVFASPSSHLSDPDYIPYQPGFPKFFFEFLYV